MKIVIKNLIPQSIVTFNKDCKKVRYDSKVVGKIIEFIETNTGIDAVAEITNKKLINKLRNGNHNINLNDSQN
jgi:hypothetical protein